MNESLNALIQSAGRAASQGRWQEAEQLWQRVRAIDPNHPQALYSLGVHDYRRGDLVAALQNLQAAHLGAPRDPVILLTISVVLRDMGDGEGELRAVDAALAIDPYFLPALLGKAACIEQRAGARRAAPIYRNALKIAPPEAQWPEALKRQLGHARGVVQRHGEELTEFLSTRMGVGLAGLTPAEAERWREAGAILGGQTQVWPSVSSRLQVPRLPAIPFFDRADFPWVAELEAQTAAITAELHGVYAQDQSGFKPYVAYPPGTPVNQWQELNHSQRWSSYFLWRNGAPVDEHAQHCPVTMAALAAVGMAQIGGLCPNAMFSALAPHTAIPPHHGETNARLIVHLPLIVPSGCSYRVGYERRQWQVGHTLIFDDTIEHEARNDSDDLRVVLIFDIWNPLLSPAERDMVCAVHAALADFHSQE